jgi:hypothetical protein
LTPARWAIVGIAVAMCSAPVVLASCGTTTEPPALGGPDTEDAGGSDADAGLTYPIPRDARADRRERDSTKSDSDHSADVGGDGSLEAEASDDTGRIIGSFDAGPCIPGCPKGVTCGLFTDCTGATLVCGSVCATGYACVQTRNLPPEASCQPTDCTGKCGVIGADTCNVPISCGGCPQGDDCVNNACVPASPEAGVPDACAPLTCTPGSGSTQLCGSVTDGCGHTLTCTCPTGQECYSGECSATPPPECVASEAGAPCGSVLNACGSGDVQCGSCSGSTKCESNVCTPCTPPTCGTNACGTLNNGCGPEVSCASGSSASTKCEDNVCTSCTPPTCGSAVCGSVNNGCGPAVSCGSCTGEDETCQNGSCCPYESCATALAAAIDAGSPLGCAPVSLGCGVTESCNPCKSGTYCDEASNSCTPCKTCADFDEIGCDLSDGCGHTLNCCGTETCDQGICCPPGKVNYDGSCCEPACSSNFPNGPQVSCGVTIYCAD